MFFCRFQWELQNAAGNKQITRVNADVKLLWDLKGDIQQVRCEIPKFGSPPTTGHCPARPKPIVDTVGRYIITPHVPIFPNVAKVGDQCFKF